MSLYEASEAALLSSVSLWRHLRMNSAISYFSVTSLLEKEGSYLLLRATEEEYFKVEIFLQPCFSLHVL